MEGPLPCEALPRSKVWRPSFFEGKIDSSWCFVRGHDRSLVSFDCERRTVRLGFGPDISNPFGLPALALRRQQAFACEFSARLSLDLFSGGGADGCPVDLPVAAGERAGIAAYYNDSYHYEIFVYRAASLGAASAGAASGSGDFPLRIGLSKRIHDMEALASSAGIPSGSSYVDFRIRADTEWYRFDWKIDGSGWNELGKGRTAGLCTEGTHHMSFTGVFFGLFASRIGDLPAEANQAVKAPPARASGSGTPYRTQSAAQSATQSAVFSDCLYEEKE